MRMVCVLFFVLFLFVFLLFPLCERNNTMDLDILWQICVRKWTVDNSDIVVMDIGMAFDLRTVDLD